jgi:hypothetical protein
MHRQFVRILMVSMDDLTTEEVQEFATELELHRCALAITFVIYELGRRLDKSLASNYLEPDELMLPFAEDLVADVEEFMHRL